MRAQDWVHPYGELPASTYWLRRAIAAVVVLVILVILWPSGGGKKHPAAAGRTTTPRSGASASPSPTVVAPACVSDQLVVQATADGEDYAAGSNPRITIGIKDVSESSCVIDTSQRYLAIVSGSDLWWSSAACPGKAAQPKVTLQPGQTVTSSYVWPRIRQAHSCSIDGTAQPGTYLAQAHLGSIQSSGAVIRLTS